MKYTPRKPGAWRLEGACLEYDSDLWYPEKDAPEEDGFTDSDYSEEKMRFPKSICAGCPIKNLCLEYALKHEPEHGVFGGMSPAERRKVILRRAAG